MKVRDALKPKSKDRIWDRLLALSIDDILIKSVLYNFKEGVIYALENGADIDINKGQPLCVAFANGHINMARFLLEKGAYPNFKEFGYTPLDESIRHNHSNFIKLFREFEGETQYGTLYEKYT